MLTRYNTIKVSERYFYYEPTEIVTANSASNSVHLFTFIINQ